MTRFAKHVSTILLFAVCACTKETPHPVPYYNTPDFTPLWLTPSESRSVGLHRLAPFSFIDQNGELVTHETTKGKIIVADFFFTRCPSACPTMTENLAAVQTAFAVDTSVMILSHSVMPWVDSVSELNRYAMRYNANPKQWKFLTGATEKIYALARTSYFAEEEIGFKKDSTEFLHTERFLLVDKDGHLRGIYNGTLKLETEKLITDIRLLNAAP
jgi:protein SCO1